MRAGGIGRRWREGRVECRSMAGGTTTHGVKVVVCLQDVGGEGVRVGREDLDVLSPEGVALTKRIDSGLEQREEGADRAGRRVRDRLGTCRSLTCRSEVVVGL